MMTEISSGRTLRGLSNKHYMYIYILSNLRFPADELTIDILIHEQYYCTQTDENNCFRIKYMYKVHPRDVIRTLTQSLIVCLIGLAVGK